MVGVREHIIREGSLGAVAQAGEDAYIPRLRLGIA